MPVILQYRSSDLYLTDRKETMTIYPHSSPHLQIRPSLVHPFLPQDLDVPCNARASCFYTLIKNRVGDDGVPAILQYRPSDFYLTDRKETMTILPKMYPHTSPHLQIRPSLVHPFLPQDKILIQMHLDVPFNAWASC